MKRFLLCLMVGMFTCVMASARDVGSKLQADIGDTYKVSVMQHFDVAPAVNMQLEIAQVIFYSMITVADQKFLSYNSLANVVLWRDPGICEQVSVINTQNNLSNYIIRLHNKGDSNKQINWVSNKIVSTTRHVIFHSI